MQATWPLVSLLSKLTFPILSAKWRDFLSRQVPDDFLKEIQGIGVRMHIIHSNLPRV
jgi:hypothetical protein